MLKPEEIFRAALSACATTDLMLAVNITRVMSADVEPNTNTGLVNLWRSIGDAVKAEIDQRPIAGLVSPTEIDQLDDFNVDDLREDPGD